MNAPEIVTLQIGHYSNFVGSHFWNCQESSFIYDPKVAAQFPKEVNHDVLYREGHTVRGEVTYTPRLVLFDLNHSLGAMKREGILYDIAGEEGVRWQGDVTLHETSAAEKNPYLLDLDKEEEDYREGREGVAPNKMEEEEDGEVGTGRNDDDGEPIKAQQDSPRIMSRDGQPFYQLDDKVTVWSDFLRPSLHARTTHIIKEHQHDNPEQPFDVFGLGEQVFSTRDSLDAMEDRIRFFTEECDRLQGFHILLDTHNAFGGVASPILSYLADEYTNKSRFSFSLTPATPPDQTPRERSCRIINSALSLHACTRLNSLHLPLCLASSLWRTVGPPVLFPHLQYQTNLAYHTSAILATALDTFTMPYRKMADPYKICDITSAFSSYGRKVSALNASVPLPLSPSTTLADHLVNLQGHDPWVSLTPHVKCVTSPRLQSCVVRGLPTTQHITRVPKSYGLASQLSLCSSADDVLHLYLTETFPGTNNAGCVMRDPIKLDPSFPHFFKPTIGRDGFTSDIPRPPFSGVRSIPLMTSLQSGSDTHGYIHSLSESARRLAISKHQHFLQAGLDPDDYAETLQDLQDLSQCYT